MTKLRGMLGLAAVSALFLAVTAQAASNLTDPQYPLSANEKLYAELAKLPVAERHAKIVEASKKESGEF